MSLLICWEWAVRQRQIILLSSSVCSLLGGMQDFDYNLFLKGNRVSEGKKNYGRVVELLITASYNREKGEFEDWGREVSVALP